VIGRDAALAELQQHRYDVVVIGGGITGAGVALDAASRGYSVALVERRDWAAGTSSRSSKLVHGGLRYLQKFDLGLVREALLERRLLVSLAPHLVKPLAFVVPSFGGKRPDRMLGTGLHLYDTMARERKRGGGAEDDWSPERHRTISGEEVIELMPALAHREPTAGYLFYDCQTDDVRLVLTVLGEAERFGAILANRLEVTELIHDAGGLARGVRCRDTLGGGEIEVRAETVVNATGVWADSISPDEFYDEEEVPRIRPSRGTHLTLSREKLRLDAGAIVPAGGGRSIFVLPWLGRTLIGTTDKDYEGPLDHIAPDPRDIDYLLGATNSFFGMDIGTGDLTGAYAGVRPLVSSGDPKRSVDISRRAELYETSSGMLTITGGKLTTFRRMAKQVVDRIVERDARDAPCKTHEIPLGMAVEPEDLAKVDGVGDETIALLVHRYGYATRDVLAVAAERPELRERIVPDMPDVLAEVVIAARAEQAHSVGDVMLRRTRLGLLAAPAVSGAGSEAARRVAVVLGGELGWDEARIELELAAWRDEAVAEGIALEQAVAP
jgi:glycerol-3-phosphate dehydrogenase